MGHAARVRQHTGPHAHHPTDRHVRWIDPRTQAHVVGAEVAAPAGAQVIELADYRRPAPRPTRRTYLRRRLTVVAGLLAAALALTLLIGNAGAQAGLEDRVAGHVVVQPGQTLWEVATAHAPSGTDPRAYLSELRELNGLDGDVAAWTVVLLPR